MIIKQTKKNISVISGVFPVCYLKTTLIDFLAEDLELAQVHDAFISCNTDV